jgi:hypothetical protein
MLINASTGSSKRDLRDYCRSLTLRAENEEEGTFLAQMHEWLADGQALRLYQKIVRGKRKKKETHDG